MSEQELLQAGLSALKANDKERASSILAQLVRQYPQSERGWFLLGMSMDAPDKRAFCLQRALTINPNNADAKKQLALLTPPSPVASTPAFYPPEPPTPAFSEERRSVEELRRELAPPDEPSLPIKKPAPKPQKKKNANNNLILLSVLSGLCVLALSIAAGFKILMSRSAAPAAAPISTATMPALIVASPATVLPTSLPTAMPTLAYTPLFETAACPFEAPGAARVTCGYAIVPEHRAKNNGRMLRLAVAVFHSPNPAPDPVVFLQGGPGAAAIELSVALYDTLAAPIVEKRDFVVFDQRGTGFSQPLMNCDELDQTYRQDIYGGLEPGSRELVYQNAFLSCSGLLQANGVDLDAYSTVQSAADLNDIVGLLGYEKVNLFGVSYGTRLALVTMRNHPGIVRAAILDSVVPVELNLVQQFPNALDSALSQLFASCAADPECAAAYPELESVFWALTQTLDANPVTLITSAYPMGSVTETVDGNYLLSTVAGLLRSPLFIKTAPQTIYRVRDGDYSTLIAAQYALPYAFDGISPGLYITMMCREHVLALSPEELAYASSQVGVEDPVIRPFYEDFEEMYDACKTWGGGGPALGERDAVASDIPSLVLEGSFDPATPPFYGKMAAETLSNSFYFEFPGMGHVPTSDDACAQKIMLGFLDNPLAPPDSSCLATDPGVDFLVPYTGTPPLELERARVFGVSVKAPRDWTLTEDGFFVRAASPFDITQATALRSFIGPQELVDYFSSSMNGYRGLDGAPVESGARQANARAWKLYSTTSNQRPVDIAIADDGGYSLVVVMFSHPDEHEALFQTVFLPMVDSAQ